MRFRELKLRKNPECPVCGEHRTITKLIDYHQFCGVPQHAAPAPVQETKVNEGEIDVTELKEKMDRGDKFVLIDVREPHEYQICSIPGAKLIPLGEFPKHVERIRSRSRYRDPLQERHAQRQGLRHPAPERLPARTQRGGRNSGVERQGRSQRSEVLSRLPEEDSYRGAGLDLSDSWLPRRGETNPAKCRFRQIVRTTPFCFFRINFLQNGFGQFVRKRGLARILAVYPTAKKWSDRQPLRRSIFRPINQESAGKKEEWIVYSMCGQPLSGKVTRL